LSCVLLMIVSVLPNMKLKNEAEQEEEK